MGQANSGQGQLNFITLGSSCFCWWVKISAAVRFVSSSSCTLRTAAAATTYEEGDQRFLDYGSIPNPDLLSK